MSFKKAWQNVEQRTFVFNAGARDERTDEEVLEDMSRSVGEAREAIEDGDPESVSLPGLTEGEERMAAVLTDMMFIAHRRKYDIPTAMIRRNTKIRNDWREKSVDSKPKQGKPVKQRRTTP